MLDIENAWSEVDQLSAKFQFTLMKELKLFQCNSGIIVGNSEPAQQCLISYCLASILFCTPSCLCQQFIILQRLPFELSFCQNGQDVNAQAIALIIVVKESTLQTQGIF